MLTCCFKTTLAKNVFHVGAKTKIGKIMSFTRLIKVFHVEFEIKVGRTVFFKTVIFTKKDFYVFFQAIMGKITFVYLS